MAILTALSVSAFRSVNTALNLSTATQAIVSELSTARQTALTLDETVQVRFYQFPDTTGAAATKEYQAMQSFRTKDNATYVALDKVILLPPTIMISSSSTYSPPLSGTATPAAAPAPSIQANGIGMNYSYLYVNFKSNGTIDPPTSGSWFITLYEKKYGAAGTPVNFTTVNVDPQNGRLRMFQP
jgi:uncharacterized protein (TIGR02596 family)